MQPEVGDKSSGFDVQWCLQGEEEKARNSSETVHRAQGILVSAEVSLLLHLLEEKIKGALDLELEVHCSCCCPASPHPNLTFLPLHVCGASVHES